MPTLAITTEFVRKHTMRGDISASVLLAILENCVRMLGSPVMMVRTLKRSDLPMSHIYIPCTEHTVSDLMVIL